MERVRSAHFSILTNGTSKDFFPACRGLSQGDPSSPFLFVIVGEALSRMIGAGSEVSLRVLDLSLGARRSMTHCCSVKQRKTKLKM